MTTQELDEIEQWFAGREFPAPVTICQGHVAAEVKKMVKSHLSVLHHKIGEKGYLPYYNRLVRLRELLMTSSAQP